MVCCAEPELSDYIAITELLFQISHVLLVDMRTFGSKARRPKNSWFLHPTKIGEVYQLNIGYKSGTGKIGFFSTSPQNSSVKIPWGPPVSCEFVVRRKSGMDDSEVVREYKFNNGKTRDSIGFDEAILNLIECGVNSFTQKLVSLCVKGHKKLLGNYVTLVQHSEGFIHHTDKHDNLGFMLDGSGIGEIMLEENGGSVGEYTEFIKLAKDCSRDSIGRLEEQESGQSNGKSDGRKRKKSGDSEDDLVKKSKTKIVNENEKSELDDTTGLEKTLKKCYIGFTQVPLENLRVADELKSMINMYRVYGVTASIRSRYDPSQAILVVCPEDDTRTPDLKQVGEQKFLVVQKIHTFLAFSELSMKGEFKNLTGHSEGTVVCYVLNTNSSALIHYGSIRGNEIANKYTRRTYPQDLLHVFESLVIKENGVSALKVVERMSKLSRVGPDESTSIRKLCQWSKEGFKVLMAVIDKFEDYETCDLKSASGNVGSIARCEKQKMTHDTFNKLAKCEEKYFVTESPQVLTGSTSLKAVVEEYQTSVEVEKVFAVLSQISGFVSKDQLLKEYPRKFEKEILVKFIGAEIKNNRKNDQASLLYDYWEKTSTKSMDEYDDPVSFVAIVEMKEIIEKKDIIDKLDFLILNLKSAQQDLCLLIMNMIISTSNVFSAGLLVFPSESLQFESLTCLRNMFFGETIKIWPIYFNSLKQKNDGKICENMDFGILFGKFSVLVPPLKRAYSHLGNISEIVKKVCPPQCTVGMITEPGLHVIKVHSSKIEHRVKYFGSEINLKRFQDELRKDKVLTVSESKSVKTNNNDSETVVEGSKDIGSLRELGETSVSPNKLPEDKKKLKDRNNSSRVKIPSKGNSADIKANVETNYEPSGSKCKYPEQRASKDLDLKPKQSKGDERKIVSCDGSTTSPHKPPSSQIENMNKIENVVDIKTVAIIKKELL